MEPHWRSHCRRKREKKKEAVCGRRSRKTASKTSGKPHLQLLIINW